MAKSSVSEVHTTQGLDFIRELGQQLRVDSIRASTTAGSGHPTSSMSAADLMAVLITRYFHYDWNDPKQPNNDHLIFSKGHARSEEHTSELQSRGHLVCRLLLEKKKKKQKKKNQTQKKK